MSSYWDALTEKTVLNRPQLDVRTEDNTVHFSFIFYNGVHLNAVDIVKLIGELRAWLDLKDSLQDRQPLVITDFKITCPYCAREWKTPKGRKAGFVMAGIYRHHEACRYDSLELTQHS